MIYKKIRLMREMRRLSQEDMADKMNMSVSGYAKIERGITKLYVEKLRQIAHIFNVDPAELVRADGGMFYFSPEPCHNMSSKQ